MSKLCSTCNKELSLSSFAKHKLHPDGLSSTCKKCDCKIKKELYIKFPEKYLLKSIRQRCENPNCKDYKDYGLRGIKCKITAHDIWLLMIRDNYWDIKRPSIDRIDNDENYTFENCRFIEMPENTRRSKTKAILQHDLQGNFIREWESGMEVERVLKINQAGISMVLNGKRKSAGGFKWSYNEKF